MCAYTYIYISKDRKLSFHIHGVVFLQKNLKSKRPTARINDIKESGIRLFFGPKRNFHICLSELLGK